ncbi:DEAD/DEAH box helicase [Siminovitchia sp. FSL H7-0308]|uniref:DEAD-box ATP-dependent RNA helicase CshB n=1 Tax=Siminovitchia thermophila TaxID=1245522 RepID=A0ABS2RCJ1_9BACI|nr:DEAD/DEAH box helicase [Siminovitchia thermophila]MBM7716281.1 ATP-dependent RNA helicase CshB [Siminovitchia thermophila]ONK24224.1 DEAD/DEAH box helicase [Bacillus sp. VT-16-64]
MAEHQFKRYRFDTFIDQAIQELKFHKPTKIQEKMIPLILKGESAIGQSQTGTGKTHAYLLPILQRVNPLDEHVQAVIFTPTRELASQIYHEALKIVKNLPEGTIVIRNYTGGTDKQRTIEKLKRQPHIVIGTPGRIHDLVREQALFVHKASILVIDEADLTFDMGFIQDVDQVAGRMPNDLEMYVFSATIPEKLKPFLKKYMENPVFEQVDPNLPTATNLQHILVPLRGRDKIDLLSLMLRTFKPFLAIVFANTKQMADNVADQLIEKGLKVGRIHGDLHPRERKRMMKQVRDLEFQYIVATDLAARGIDIPGVSHIIHYELPRDLDFYIHRSGRTARAGNEGISITIYESSDEDAINRLEKLGIEFEYRDIQDGEWVEAADRKRREKRKSSGNTAVTKAHQIVRKPKKVKPGYKKKMKAEIEKIMKRERRMQKRKKK